MPGGRQGPAQVTACMNASEGCSAHRRLALLGEGQGREHSVEVSTSLPPCLSSPRHRTRPAVASRFLPPILTCLGPWAVASSHRWGQSPPNPDITMGS